jgi:hypothetical protein
VHGANVSRASNSCRHVLQVHVYDVDKNIMGPMCTQKVARKAKLTKLAFNPRQPIIAVGEEKCVSVSPLPPMGLLTRSSHCSPLMLA